jgi:hypothetical protein
LDLLDNPFLLEVIGAVEVPEDNAELAFQMDLIPGQCPDQVCFGFAVLDEPQGHRIPGFAVRLDLQRGEVWDALNGAGLLGELETGPLGLGRYHEEEPLLLSLVLEKRGRNLLPRLRIGHETLLYPALLAQPGQVFSAITGSTQPGADAPPFCLYPAVWVTHTV